MSNDISKSVSQRGRGEEIAENRRIYEVSDELLRRSQLYEAQLRDGQKHVSRLEAEQRVAEQDATLATPVEIDTYMAALGFTKLNNEGRYANADFEVWDLVPRNVLKDKGGDIYIIDAEIKEK
jgi:hypothetical protein